MKCQAQYQNLDFLRATKSAAYGFAPTPFGEALLIFAQARLIGLAFVKKSRRAALDDMKARFAPLTFTHQPQQAENFFNHQSAQLTLIGTPFQHQVWRALLDIPKGNIIDYATLAEQIGRGRAARAVGAAVGRNPISWLVPCHRVIRRNGALGGYHWGLAVKQKLLAQEGVHIAA